MEAVAKEITSDSSSTNEAKIGCKNSQKGKKK